LIPAIRFSCDLREDRMRRFVEGVDRGQTTLFPECLEDWIDEDWKEPTPISEGACKLFPGINRCGQPVGDRPISVTRP